MKKCTRTSMRFKSVAVALASCSLFAVTAFAASESGSLGSRGSYEFFCSSGNVFSKYITATSTCSYNGNTANNYIFSNGRARVVITLSDGTNNQKNDDFSGTDFSGTAPLTVHGLNEGSAYCYARVSGVFLNSNNKYTDTNDIEASTLYP